MEQETLLWRGEGQTRLLCGSRFQLKTGQQKEQCVARCAHTHVLVGLGMYACVHTMTLFLLEERSRGRSDNTCKGERQSIAEKDAKT